MKIFFVRIFKPIVFAMVFLFIMQPFSMVYAQESSRQVASQPAEQSYLTQQPVVAVSAKENSVPPIKAAAALEATSAEQASKGTASGSVFNGDTDSLSQNTGKADSAETNSQAPLSGIGKISAMAAAESGNIGTVTTPDDNVPNKTFLKISPNESNGALIYEYPLVLPPGRLGMTPGLALKYNSQNSDPKNIFGFGWDISIPYIQRENIGGVDRLYDNLDFSSSFSGRLTSVSTTTGSTIQFAAQVENGDFLSYVFNTASGIWTASDKKGLTYTFGKIAQDRQDNPGNPAQVYKWMVSSIEDHHGNAIKFTYAKDNGQIYPATINYTAKGQETGQFTVRFSLSATVRADSGPSYETAFKVQTNYTIAKITVEQNGAVVRSYDLSYSVGSFRVLLASIVESGRDPLSNSVVTLPPVIFNYSKSSGKLWQKSSTVMLPVFIDNMRVKMADVNGDGRADIIQSYTVDYAQTRKVFLNTGSGWSWDAGWTVPVDFFISRTAGGGSNAVPYIELTDINGDGRADIYECGDSTSPPKIFINNGKGWDLGGTNGMANWTAPACLYPSVSTGGVASATADLNGDGLPDFINTRNYLGTITSSLNANNGVGWSGSGALNSSATPVSLVDKDNYDNGVRTYDVNGDGLADLLQSKEIASEGRLVRSAYLNEGNGHWDANSVYVPGFTFTRISGSFTPSATTYLNPVIDIDADGRMDYLSSDGSNGPTFTRDINDQVNWSLADIDGDGMTDYVRTGCLNFICGSDPANQNYTSDVFINTSAKPDLLTSVQTPEGAVTGIAYKPSSQYKFTDGTFANPDLPAAVNTVEKITTTDITTGLASTESYFYSGGKYFFNGSFDRKFSGFTQVAKTDSQGNTATQFFLQPDLAQNFPLAASDPLNAYNHSQSLSGKVYKTEFSDASGKLLRRIVNSWQSTNLGPRRDFAAMTQTVAMDYDGLSTHADKAESYSYNQNSGNLTQKTEWGRVTAAPDGAFTDTGNDKFTTTLSYASASGRPTGFLAAALKVDQGANKASEAKYFYDNLPFGSVNAGDLTEQHQWKSGSAYVKIYKSYNPYGLTTTETDGRGKNTYYSYDAANLSPVLVTNALGQKTGYAYDYANGKITSKTDENNFQYSFKYDGLGRLLEARQPDLANPASLVPKTTYEYTDTPGSVSVKRTDYLNPDLSVFEHAYFDSLRRLVQTRKTAEGPNNFVIKDLVYNDLGLLQKESLPYFGSGPDSTGPIFSAALFRSFGYDGLGRITSLTDAVGKTSTAYNNWKTTVINSRNKPKDFYYDAYGNLIQVTEYNNGSAYQTSYAYDGLGNLAKITDASGNIRNFNYDGLGRRLLAEDLHAPSDSSFGAWSYVYDDNGNVVSNVDPKNQIINYTYDDLNRQLTEDLLSTPETEVVSYYDLCNYGVGKLCRVVSFSVATDYSYDPLGRVASETKKIDGKSYLTSYSYDRQGNSLGLINPDGSEVRYFYNSAGQLKNVKSKGITDSAYTDAAAEIIYNPAGHEESVTYGNSVKTVNTYDSNHLYRLTNKKTLGASGSAKNMLANCAASPTSAQPGSTVLFSSTVTGGTFPYSYSWNGGTWGTASTTSQTFMEPGAQTAYLQVIDSGTPVQTRNVSCAVNILQPPFSEDFTRAPLSLPAYTDKWNYTDGGAALDLNINGIFTLNTDRSPQKFQMISKQKLYGDSDVSFTFASYLRGSTRVGLWNGDWGPSAYIDTNADQYGSANSFLLSTPSGDSGSKYKGSDYQGRYITVRIKTNGSQAMFYVDGQLLETLPFTYAGPYAISFSSGNYRYTDSMHYSSFDAISGTDNYTQSGNYAVADGLSSLNQNASTNPVAISAGAVTQDLSYLYDEAGNITEIVDNSETDNGKKAVYSYDDLDRLTSAVITNAVKGGNYTENFSYDALGNMLSQSLNGQTTSYAYQGSLNNAGTEYANPHAFTKSTATSTPTSAITIQVLNLEKYTGPVIGIYSDRGDRGSTPPALPVIDSFVSTPTTVTAGDAFALSWTLSGGAPTDLTIDNGVGSVLGQSSVSVTQWSDTNYTLTAINSAGMASKQLTVALSQAATPQFSPPGGSFTAPVQITLSSATPGASIYYTTDGSTPSLSSTLYTAPFTLSTGATVKAMAVKSGYTNSQVSSQTYTITAPPPSAPVINTFSANPASITSGQSTTLSWTVSGSPTTLTIDNGVGSVLGLSSKSVSPATTTTYTLTATNSSGTVTKTVTVGVTGPPPAAPIITTFTASPAVINSGQSSTLSWTLSGGNPTTLTIDNGIGSVLNATSTVVFPSVTTTYTLTASNASGPVSKQVTVTVQASPPPPPPPSDPVNLALNKPASQSSTYPSGTTLYSYDAVNAVDDYTDGSNYRNITLTNPESNAWWQVDLGQSSTISSIEIWNRTDCCTSNISDYWVFVSNTPFAASDKPANLSTRANTWNSHQTIAPNPNTTISVPSISGRYVRVQLNNLSYLNLAEVKVMGTAGSPPVNPPVINTFTANPTTITSGQSVNLSWVLAGGSPTALSVDNGVGSVLGLTSKSVSPATTTTYTLTATNSGGTVTKQVTVNVSAPPPSAPVINTFTSNPTSITSGQSASLSWTLSGGSPTTLTVDNGVGSVLGLTSKTVSPSTTTTYTLTATNSSGTVTKQVTVTVQASPPPPPPPPANPVNLSLSKPASQSSTYPYQTSYVQASNAVNGNTNGYFSDSAVSLTNPESNAWWQVDLGQSSTISTVNIWNRTDCCSANLSDYWIFVSDTPFLSSDKPSALAARANTWNNHQTVMPNPSTSVTVPNAQGRYVRVQLNGNNYLSLAEVEVIGIPVPPAPVISSFVAASSAIISGQSATLSWTVSGNPTTLTIDNGVGSVLGLTSKSVSPATTTTYTLTATNGGGTVTSPVTVTVSSLPQAQAPVITPNGGSFNNSVTVSMTSSTTGASIYYTLNNTAPNVSSTLYSAPFTLSSSTVVTTIAIKTGYTSSTTTSASFSVNQSSPITDVKYDKNGNMVSETGGRNAQYIYDYKNRLIQASVNGVTSTYLYDHTGQRVMASNTDTGKTTYYPSKSYNTEYDSSGQQTKQTRHIYAQNLLLATTETTPAGTSTPQTSQVFYHLPDHLGSTSVSTNEQGNVVELTDYYPYGTARLDEHAGSFDEQRKFIGEIYDGSTGLNYLNARYYNGVNGKFISQDPAARDVPEKFLADPQQMNYYSYARNNPITLSDPSGQCIDGISTIACIAAWTFLSGIILGTGVETYGAIKGDPKTIELGQHTRGTAEIGGAGLIEATGRVNPITGSKGLVFEVKPGTFEEIQQKNNARIQAEINAVRANNLVDSIDSHGSYEKHVIQQREYGSLFQSKDQWREYVGGVISNPSESFSGPSKNLYWDSRLGTIVIDNKTGGAPTAFRPKEGAIYYQERVAEQQAESKKGGGR